MKLKSVFQKTILLIVFVALLSACTSQPAPTPSPAPIKTVTPSPTLAATPTTTATSTPLPTATLIPHPLSIEGLRVGEYPDSDILIEETLDSGINYSRYYVSYLSEGLKIYGLLTVPDGEMPEAGWPVVVFNHGYIPPDVYRTTERYIAYVDEIARSGYIVFRTDYRGHDQSEGEARGAYSRPDYTIDVLNAVASIKRYPAADPERIGMWGHSMGGYITMRSMVVGEDIKAGVIWAGVVASYPDMLTKWRRGDGTTPIPTPRPNSWRTSLFERYGNWDENPEFWDSISANAYLNDISGPVQLHHGTNDADVPLAFSETLFYQLLEADQYVELYKYDGDNHNISNYFSLAMQRTIEFYDSYLK